MTLELLTALASLGTFVVITATAIAAIVQLRHMRASNQIDAINSITDFQESAHYLEALKFVNERAPELSKNPDFRKLMYMNPSPPALQPLHTVANLYERLGALVKHGAIDADVACDLWSDTILSAWDKLQPIIAAKRHVTGPEPWENFEYLAGLCKTWIERHFGSSLPRGARRVPVDAKYLADDIATGVVPPGSAP